MSSKVALYYLATALKNIINNSNKFISKQNRKEITDGFESAKELLHKAFDDNKPYRIGLFGGMSTGKSSLINLLIGVDLLPVADFQLSSSVIEIVGQKSHKDKLYTIELTNNDGKVVKNQDNISFDEAKKIIEEYGSHRNDSLSNEIAKIKIISDFSKSKILCNNGVLIDSPGAEIDFGTNKESSPKKRSEKRNDLDTEKTLKILDTVDFVLFLGRADYLEINNSILFYKKLKPHYDTLEILNKKDMRKKGSEEELQFKFAEILGCPKTSPICISCSYWEEGKETNNKDLLKKSNIELLENKILDKINNNNSERYLYNCLKRIEKILGESCDYGKLLFEDSQLEFYEFIKANSCNYSDILISFISFISSILKSILLEMSFKSFLKTVVIHKNKLLSYRCSDNIIALAKSIYTKFHTNGIDC